MYLFFFCKPSWLLIGTRSVVPQFTVSMVIIKWNKREYARVLVFFFFWAWVCVCVSRGRINSDKPRTKAKRKNQFIESHVKRFVILWPKWKWRVCKYTQLCWSNNCHLLESKFYLHAYFRRILSPIWWETKRRTLHISFVRRYFRPFDIVYVSTRQIGMRSGTPAFLPAENFPPQKNKYTIKNITILSHSPQVI